MPLPRWMIERLRDTMGEANHLDLPHQTAVGLHFRKPDSPHRGTFTLTRDMLNGIRPEDDPPSRPHHGYVLKNGIYQA